MKVLFFAQAREAAGCAEGQLKADRPLAVPEFWTRLVADFPRLAPLRKTARLARAEEYLQEGDLLQPGDEIAVIPPVSGG
jgi:molybdopterin converting factor subunit 1